ncbi:MAG: DUF2927 domain-containing protein [Paracoccaceae bacterium]|nr:DUF2927 domain-containing protein [Paracoccaceae bacterium]
MSHEVEGGARRPHLVRYEALVTVTPEGAIPGLEAFLDGYLAQLRAEAGVPTSRGVGGNLLIRFADGPRFARAVPGAACAIAAGDVTWQAFSHDPEAASGGSISALERIDRMTIFVPDDALPYRVRNCLLEEIPQALGLSSDLFGLGMSSFNDDGAHIWPTKLDYLMLRLLYAPEIETGLDRRETRARANALLDRINPQGRNAPRLPRLRTSGLGEWSDSMAKVFSRRTSGRARIKSIDKALTLIQANAPGSAQHCHTLVTAGRVLSRPDPARAVAMLDQARTICETAHGPQDVRLARIGLEKACALLRLARYNEAISLAEATWPIFAAYRQDERLAALYTIEADALAATEPGSERAARTAERARAWNAYAVGPGRRASNCRPSTG